jgi:lipopolysaccharide export system protein LptC
MAALAPGQQRSAAAEAARESRRRAMMPGSARDTWVAILKVGLPVASALLLLVLLWLPLAATQEFSFLLSKENTEAASERLLVQEARYRGATEAGEPFEIRAERAVQASSAVPVVHLSGLAAEILRADGRATVTAPSGHYNLDTQQILIDGPVEVRSESGFALDGEAIEVSINDRTVVSGQPVTGAVPLGTFRAGRFAADVEGRRVVMEGGVALRIAPRAASGRG